MNDIERQAMDYLLRGDHPVLATLREQLAAATVAAREFTGVGFFTRFDVPPTVARLPSARRIVLHDVHAEVSGLQHGAGFALFVEGGVLDTLECFIYEDAWPPDAKLLRLYYMKPREPGEAVLVETPERDLEWQQASQAPNQPLQM
jgi:hypothetical protein